MFMKRTQWFLAATGAAGLALSSWGQVPATRPAASQPTATTPTIPIPVNLDRRLQDLVTLDADGVPLASFIDSLRKITQTNITVNWNALTAAGVARDVPVTMHIKDASYEAAVRALMEILPG